jgi:ornithine cyclodeaminase
MDAMADALRSLSRQESVLPLRSNLWLPDKTGTLCMMPAYMGGGGALGLKVITYFAGNLGTELDTHQGVVLLFEPVHGRLLAIIDATAITSIRTPAVTAVATRLLARPDAGDLAILGSGTQARGHLKAMRSVRNVRRVRVWSRPIEHARKFADEESHSQNVAIEVMPTAGQAVAGADLICTVTSALEPVLKGEWLEPGAHINAVGSSIPHARELDTAAVVISKLFVDRRESALAESGDFLFPKNEGAIDESHIRGEIGDVLNGRTPGRTSPSEITLFKSLGLAIEDLAAASLIYRKAGENGVGTWIELGGSRRPAVSP